MEENYTVSSYDINAIVFTKPRKHGEYMVCKIKHNGLDVKVQFPKMKITNILEKNISLEFTNDAKYNKTVYNFLSDVDKSTTEYISEHSKEWFGKKIPIASVKSMFQSTIKAPVSSENKCTVQFTLNPKTTLFFDKKNEEIEVTELRNDQILECISQMKYIVFSKDTCFINWELCTGKFHKKIKSVPKYGFIEDPDDHQESDDEEININCFF